MWVVTSGVEPVVVVNNYVPATLYHSQVCMVGGGQHLC